MSTLKIIKEYYGSTDHDLQYMALREDFSINDIDNDVSLLMNKLILPILSNEQSMELVNLVCYELLPRIIKKIRESYKGNSDIFKLIETKILVPFVNGLDIEKRSLLFLQCLKVTLKVIHDLMKQDFVKKTYNGNINIPGITFNIDDSFVKFFSKKILKRGLFEVDKHLCYESLTYLIQLYYDGRTHCIGKDVLTQILKECSQDEDIDPAAKSLLSNLFLLSNCIELSYVSDYIDEKILLETSTYWYKYSMLVNEYFDTRLLPKLEIRKIVDSGEMFKILTILTNFKPFYSTRILHVGSSYLSQTNVIRLIKDLIKLSNSLEIEISGKKLDNNLFSHSSTHVNNGQYINTSSKENKNSNGRGKKYEEEDSYLEELSKTSDPYDCYNEEEEEYIAFEEEEEEEAEYCGGDKKNDNIDAIDSIEDENKTEIKQMENIKSMIMDILYSCDISPAIENHFLVTDDSVVSEIYHNLGFQTDANGIFALFQFSPVLEDVDLNLIINDKNYREKILKEDIFHSLDYKFASSIDNLTDLQFCVDIIEKLIRDPNFELNTRDKSIISLMLIPHIKRNKQFIRIIKVGNMKQKVDEGSSTRTSIYSILSQMDKLPFNVACKILEDVVANGLKDKNETIQFLSGQIINKILKDYYDTIQALAEDWYQETIMNNLLEVLYRSSDATSSETATLSNIVEKYPVINSNRENE